MKPSVEPFDPLIVNFRFNREEIRLLRQPPCVTPTAPYRAAVLWGHFLVPRLQPGNAYLGGSSLLYTGNRARRGQPWLGKQRESYHSRKDPERLGSPVGRRVISSYGLRRRMSGQKPGRQAFPGWSLGTRWKNQNNSQKF
jgi:hypothetical protein